MLIHERLTTRQGFSQTECAIADHFLTRGSELRHESARQVARETYTVPSTITRFCKKLGFSGYPDFLEEWVEQQRYLEGHFKEIDPNRPFDPGDSIATIGAKLGSLYQEVVRDTLALQQPDALATAVRYCRWANTVYVCSAGPQSGIAASFAEKMAKIGRIVMANARADVNYIYASTCATTDCFILVSYSGETPSTLRVAEKLREREVHTVVVTSYGGNTLSEMFSCRLYLSTRERMVSNLGNFGVHLSSLYLLDLLYAGVFNANFDKNYALKTTVSAGFAFPRSNNPVLTEARLATSLGKSASQAAPAIKKGSA